MPEKNGTVIGSDLHENLETLRRICADSADVNIMNVRICGTDCAVVTAEGLVSAAALADLVVSRAGANAICELLALRKPNLLIPLSKNASRGDQILNARSFEKQGFSYVIEEEELSQEKLLSAITSVWEHRADYISAMNNSEQMDPIKTITDLIEATAKK